MKILGLIICLIGALFLYTIGGLLIADTVLDFRESRSASETAINCIKSLLWWLMTAHMTRMIIGVLMC